MKGTRKNQITQIHCDVNECGASFIVRFKRMGGHTFSNSKGNTMSKQSHKNLQLNRNKNIIAVSTEFKVIQIHYYRQLHLLTTTML